MAKHNHGVARLLRPLGGNKARISKETKFGPKRGSTPPGGHYNKLKGR